MKELTVPAAPEQLGAVTAFVSSEIAACPKKARIQIETAVEEIFVNIARYAYHPETGTATIRCEAKDGVVTIQFLDRGRPFDPLKRRAADTTLSAEKRGVGGLGILMVRESMDAVDYAYEGGMNRFTIKKKFGIPGRRSV
ncbi:MAG TPA: ATP-binding protein [Feifaniaceae bacterium]|nr:ATP-binding protein [Feifaniaceae bacterium]